METWQVYALITSTESSWANIHGGRGRTCIETSWANTHGVGEQVLKHYEQYTPRGRTCTETSWANIHGGRGRTSTKTSWANIHGGGGGGGQVLNKYWKIMDKYTRRAGRTSTKTSWANIHWGGGGTKYWNIMSKYTRREGGGGGGGQVPKHHGQIYAKGENLLHEYNICCIRLVSI